MAPTGHPGSEGLRFLPGCQFLGAEQLEQAAVTRGDRETDRKEGAIQRAPGQDTALTGIPPGASGLAAIHLPRVASVRIVPAIDLPVESLHTGSDATDFKV
jgi:hypothetical protein